MPSINAVRKLVVGFTPPIFYPMILKVINSEIMHSFLRKSGAHFYSLSWHVVPKGKLKGLRFFLDSSSGEWQQSMTTGTYDEYFLDVLKGINLKKKVFVDIGAHIGYSSLCFARLSDGQGTSYAFEPNQYNRERLQMHIENNGKYGDAIRVYPQAISDKNGKAEFVFTNNVDGWTSSGSFLDSAHTTMAHDKYERDYGFIRSKIETITLDSFAKKEKVIPDVIKIDVEGAEHLVLAGGRETLTKNRPLLLIELHSIFATVRSMDLLSQYGYQTKILHEEEGRVFIVATAKGKKFI